jgi:hypothetical protein
VKEFWKFEIFQSDLHWNEMVVHYYGSHEEEKIKYCYKVLCLGNSNVNLAVKLTERGCCRTDDFNCSLTFTESPIRL